MGGDFFGAIAFLGALGAARSTRIFWGWWIFCDSFFGALGATRSTRSNSDFEGGDFWAIAFLEVLGVARSTRSSSEHSDFVRVGIFGSTRSNSEQLGALGFFEGGDFWGLFLIGSVGFSGLGHLFSDAALL